MFKPNTFAFTALLGALTALGPLSTDLYLPVLPEIGQALGVPPAQVQLTLSAYLIGFAIGQTFYGPISDWYGRRSGLLIALVCYCGRADLLSVADHRCPHWRVSRRPLAHRGHCARARDGARSL